MSNEKEVEELHKILRFNRPTLYRPESLATFLIENGYSKSPSNGLVPLEENKVLTLIRSYRKNPQEVDLQIAYDLCSKFGTKSPVISVEEIKNIICKFIPPNQPFGGDLNGMSEEIHSAISEGKEK